MKHISNAFEGWKQHGREIAGEIDINTEWRKGCDICVAFCLKQVLELNRRDKCIFPWRLGYR